MGLPFENIKISGFRGLKDLSLEGLGRVNLLVGENNSGKTSVLEAISIYANPFDWPNWLTTAQSRDIRSSVPGARYPRIELIKWLFVHPVTNNHVQPFEGEITLSASGGIPHGVVSALGTEAYGTPPVSRFMRQPARSKGEGDISEEQPCLALTITGTSQSGETQAATTTIWEYEPILGRNRSKGIPCETITPVTHRIMDTQTRFYSRARFENFKEQALDAMRLIDSGIIDLEILVPQGGYRSAIPYVHHSNVGLAPLNAFGDGFRRVLTMALMLASSQKGILLIDEIETAIHKDALAKVFSWLVKTARDMDVQIFATTHSLEAVDAILKAELETLDEVVGYHLEREGEIVRAKRISGDLLARLRYKRGLDIR